MLLIPTAARAVRGHQRPVRRCARGYSIIELMVAITISLIVLAALVTLFAANSRERGAIERANQQSENGRYALQVLGDDLRNAGYLGPFNPGTVAAPNPQLTIPTTVPDPCDPTLSTLNSALAIAVQGSDNGTNAPSCVSDLRAGTDILVVRRASTCTVGASGCDLLTGGDVYLQLSGCNAEISGGTYYALDSKTANLNLHLKDCATTAPLYQLRTHIYFVANNDKSGDGIPTLKRVELDKNGFVTIVPLSEGVESLQIEYGIDLPDPLTGATTGAPAVYNADPGSYNGCAGKTAPFDCVSNWRNVVSAKVTVLARDLSTTQGYSDAKTYTLGLNAAGQAQVLGPYTDSYKRHTFYTVARLYNPAGRNTP